MELLLENIARHVKLTQEEQALVCSRFHVATLKKKEFLLRAGEICRFENFVLEGCLRTYTIDEKGNERILIFAPEDWWAGDLYSFLSGNPSSYFIDAIENSHIAQVSKENLEALYKEIPALERFFRLLLQNAFIAQQKRILGNISLSAEERYRDFQKTYPQLDLRLTQKQIAAFLGITPEFLSMLRAKRSD